MTLWKEDLACACQPYSLAVVKALRATVTYTWYPAAIDDRRIAAVA